MNVQDKREKYVYCELKPTQPLDYNDIKIYQHSPQLQINAPPAFLQICHLSTDIVQTNTPI